MKVFIDGIAPTKAHQSDAAFDLYASQSDVIPALGWRLIPCGFTIAIPERYVGLICSRSGLARMEGVFVMNSPGVIDPGYRGEVAVILMNFSDIDYTVFAGDRIAQLLIVPNTQVELVQNKNFFDQPTDRGEHGFGSTGVA